LLFVNSVDAQDRFWGM